MFINVFQQTVYRNSHTLLTNRVKRTVPPISFGTFFHVKHDNSVYLCKQLNSPWFFNFLNFFQEFDNLEVLITSIWVLHWQPMNRNSSNSCKKIDIVHVQLATFYVQVNVRAKVYHQCLTAWEVSLLCVNGHTSLQLWCSHCWIRRGQTWRSFKSHRKETNRRGSFAVDGWIIFSGR